MPQEDFGELFTVRYVESNGMNESLQDQPKILTAKVVEIIEPEVVDLQQSPRASLPRQRSVRLPLLLFIATCLSTLYVGALSEISEGLTQALKQGLLYAVPVMTILVCHEMGHFWQSYRYGVFATWPYFIPVPLPPIGTMGAVIAMEPRMGHRRALFDIGISGPLAGLVPTIICCIVGIQLSSYKPQPAFIEPGGAVHAPLLFQWILAWMGKEGPSGSVFVLHPVAFAGWVGLLITSLNLIPIGQLDGGHILYALLRKKAHYVATIILFLALVTVGIFHLWSWSLMLILLILMGPQHPPTANDEEPLGIFRYILGWLTLAFVLIGFTPQPFIMN